MIRWLFLILLLFTLNVNAKKVAPINDDLINAINLSNTDAFCSADQAYNNFEATSSPNGIPNNWNGTVGKDVWFKFTALKFDVAVTASGRVNGASPNTMVNPLVAIYTTNPNSGTFGELYSTMLSSSNVTSVNVSGLTIGQVYYIRISALNNNEGSFQLCVNNFFPPSQPGQDCATVSILCSMEKFTQLNVIGAGTNNRETAGTCLETEHRSAWYMWTAGKSGALTFLITPTVTTNDIDWVLYDLGPGGTCAQVTAANAIRCAVGSGVDCNPSYYVTGLSMTDTDLTEQSGCPPGPPQNGLVRYVDAIEGHNYALLVDNFTPGNNGFSIEFGGDTEFKGPTSEIQIEKINACTPQQSFNFTSLATNYNSLKWTFGEGASIANATGIGPYNVTYSTYGEKTVVLEAKTASGCNVVSTKTFFVALKPALPTISTTTVKFCPGNEVTLNTPKVDFATYHWSGPNGFTSTDQNAKVNITGPENAGDYHLYIQVGDCLSDVATITVPPIDPKPEALFDVVVNNACLANQSFTFVNKSINTNGATWDFGTGVSFTTTAANGNQTVFYTTTGEKEITLIATSPSGCLSTFTKKINVQIKPKKPIITANQTKFCLGEVIKFSIEEFDGLTYEWLGPNGFTATTSSIEIKINSFDQAGTYFVSTKIGDCKSDVTSITIPPIAKVPVAIFYTDPKINGKYEAPLPIVFSNYSKDADSYLWDFGDGTTSTEANPTHIYEQNGVYKITLTAFADEGCSHSLTMGDLILKDATLFVPNAFSPNGDGVNDVLNVTILNLKKYQLFIYNRLGENVFQTTDIFNNWDGKFKNKDVSVGVYYYVIMGKTVGNKDVKYTGSITLIR